MSCAGIILAAGKGTRMSSDLPKVLHEIDGKPMISFVLDAIRPIVRERVYVVVGYRADDVIAACSEDVRFVHQHQQLGTGHAVMQCENALDGFSGTVVVLNGDVPCLRTRTVTKLLDYHHRMGAAGTVLTAKLDDPSGYGRIVTDGDGSLLKIVEDRDADAATRQIDEINSGLFTFDKDKLFKALKSVDRGNDQGEYYLTDVIATLKDNGEAVHAFCVKDPQEVAGVNTDQELEAIRDYLRGKAS